MSVTHALAGQPINVRRVGKLVTVATERGAHVFGGYPKNVRPRAGCRHATQHEDGEERYQFARNVFEHLVSRLSRKAKQPGYSKQPGCWSCQHQRTILRRRFALCQMPK